MATPEGRVKKKIRDYLKERGAYHYMPVQNGMGVVGIPDIVGCYKGQFFAIEVKAPGKKSTVTPNQQNQINLIGAAQGHVCVADCVEDVRILFLGMSDGSD